MRWGKGVAREDEYCMEREINEEIENPICIKAKTGAYPEGWGETWDIQMMKEDNR